jgi:TPR repeat protein
MKKKPGKWYLKGAQRDSANAQYNLATCYRHGIGIAKNEKLSFEWMLRSAQQNYVSALYYISLYYRDGIGTPTDYAKAMEWLKKASQYEDHNDDADNNIGIHIQMVVTALRKTMQKHTNGI